jgi:hypothetical protein
VTVPAVVENDPVRRICIVSQFVQEPKNFAARGRIFAFRRACLAIGLISVELFNVAETVSNCLRIIATRL